MNRNSYRACARGRGRATRGSIYLAIGHITSPRAVQAPLRLRASHSTRPLARPPDAAFALHDWQMSVLRGGRLRLRRPRPRPRCCTLSLFRPHISVGTKSGVAHTRNLNIPPSLRPPACINGLFLGLSSLFLPPLCTPLFSSLQAGYFPSRTLIPNICQRREGRAASLALSLARFIPPLRRRRERRRPNKLRPLICL